MSSEGLHVPRDKLRRETLTVHYAITSLIELREYLFTEGSITGREDAAMGKDA
jgi:hypothetical protein